MAGINDLILVTDESKDLTDRESILLKAFQQAADSNADGSKNLDLVALSKEIRALAKERDKKNKIAVARPPK